MSSTNGTSGYKGLRTAIVIYAMHDHIVSLAECVKAGVESAGGNATIYQVPETLPQEVLQERHAPAKPDYPMVTLETLTTYDAFLFGISTQHGNYPAQWKTFWDATGKLWAAGALTGKYAGVFVTVTTQGGGQEETIQKALSTFVHHGIIYVPLGYKTAFHQLNSMKDIHGGSPWGAGAFTGFDNSRGPSALELEIAGIQGKAFAECLAKVGPMKPTNY